MNAELKWDEEDTAVMVPEGIDRVAKQDIDWTDRAMAIQEITTPEMLVAAKNLSDGGYELEKAYTDLYEPMRKAAYAAYEKVLEERNKRIAPIKKIRMEHLDPLIYRYAKRQQEEQRKAAEEARKIAEQAKALQLEAAKEAGASQAVLQQIDQALIVPPPAPPLPDVKIKDTYEITVEDAGLVPEEIQGVKLWTVDLKAIKKLVDANKGAIVIPGVKIEAKGKVNHRRGK